MDEFDGGFIEAVNVRGEKQRIPAAWLDHPVLGKDFSTTPRQKAAVPVASNPSDTPASRGDKKE